MSPGGRSARSGRLPPGLAAFRGENPSPVSPDRAPSPCPFEGRPRSGRLVLPSGPMFGRSLPGVSLPCPHVRPIRRPARTCPPHGAVRHIFFRLAGLLPSASSTGSGQASPGALIFPRTEGIDLYSPDTGLLYPLPLRRKCHKGKRQFSQIQCCIGCQFGEG